MGMTTAIKNGQILDNAYGVLGIELMAAAQALDFRELTPGVGTRAAQEAVRQVVAHLGEDRPLHADHTRMKELVRSGAVLDAVEAAIGPLPSPASGEAREGEVQLVG
jgi:histidine ammonia-lyase